MIKMFGYLKSHLLSVFLILVLVTITSLGQLLLPDYMSRMIGEGITPVYEVYDETLEQFVPVDYCDIELNPDTCIVVGQESDMAVITHYGIIMIGVTIGSSIAAILLMYLSSHVASMTGKNIREDLYRKISHFSMAEADNFGTSTLITRSTNDVVQVQNYMIMVLRMVLRIPIIFIGAIIMAWRKSQQLTTALLGGIPALVILIVVSFIIVLPLFKSLQKKVDKITQVTREGINGVRVIRAFGKGKKEVKRFEEVNEDLTGTILKTGKIMSMLNPAVNLIFNSVILGVIYAAFRMLSGGTLTGYQDLANVSAVMQYSFQIMFSLLMLTMTFIMYPRAEVSGKRISEVLEQITLVKDEGKAEYDDMELKGKIEFDNVCFKYADAEKNVLENITFTANPGETVAIIGSTGSGKSTAINLLPRFFDISCGSIRIDGIDIREFKLKKLRSLIGFVPQTSTLFSGTIRDNIIYGKPNATQEEIEKAAEIGQAKEFIDELDDGYDAIVDQRGVNFSGGQKQRIAIARALIRRPKIYVFDDSFSALDFKTDSLLRKALKKDISEATILIVAQRIGTIMDSDQIIVMHEGKIVGKGKHRELLKDCEVYREIALSQLSEEELSL